MSNYWIILQQQYQQWGKKVNQSMVLRERLLLLAILLAAIYAVWSLLSATLLPQKVINVAKVEETSLTQQVKQLQQKIAEAEKNVTTITSNLSAQNIPLGGGLVSISMVIPLLKTLVTQQSDMNLQEVINLPDKLLDFTADMKLPVPLYAQGLTFVFTNNFVNTYAYLRALEDLKWMIFWDELQYVVGQYPNAEVKLTLHTVSKEKEN